MKLKVLSIIFCTILGVNFQCLSQTGFGIRAGGNATYITVSKYVVKPGVHAGVYAMFLMSKTFYLQPEVLYSQKGGTTRETNTKKYYNPLTQKLYQREIYTLDYIDFNLLLRCNIWKGFHALAGPQFSILIQDLYKYNNGYKERDTYNYSDARRVDFGIHAGLGYEFKNGILFALRGDAGFLKILSGHDSKNLAASASIGYTIFGKRIK